MSPENEPLIFRMRDPETGVISEVEVTQQQADDLMAGKAIAWSSPEVPDVLLDEDGIITEREDARPKIKPDPPDS